jgi:hypothetical protein
MKKVLFGLILAGTINLSLCAQTSNYERQLIGTWEFSGTHGWVFVDYGSTWVFKSDGFLTVDNDFNPEVKNDFHLGWPVYYSAAGNKLVLSNEAGGGGCLLCDYYISSDGNTLIIITDVTTYQGEKEIVGLPFKRKK